MLFGLVFLIIIIFLIHVGISGGDYGLSYFGILFLTMAFWGGYKSSTKDHTNGGCLPELLLVVSLMVWMLLGQTDCGENFPLFILAYFIIVISYILYSVNAQKDGKHKKLDIESKSEDKLRAEKILDTLKWTRTGSLQNDTPTYISLRHEAPSIADFDWVIKYISIYGRNSNSNPLNYYTNKYAFIGKSLYMCNKINSTNIVLHIYREPISEAGKNNLQEASYPSGMEPKFVVDKVGRSSSSYIPQTSSQKYRINNVRNVEVEVEESASGSIEASIGVDESSDSPDNERAVRILNVQNWVELIARDKGRFQYVCRKDDSPDPDDFKWVVGYLSGRGIPENPKNPHTYVVSELDGVKYKSIKVNKFFEGTVIYKMVDTAIISSEENSGSIHSTAEKFRHHINNYLTGNRMEEDPVVQYNLELIEEYKLELKEKIEEYNRLKAQKDDEIIISQSTTGMIDLEELNDQLDELREEIEDLIADIEDLKEEKFTKSS